MTTQLALIGDLGRREQHTEERLIVNPGQPHIEWAVEVPPGADARQMAKEFVVPTRIERRTVITYTSDWQPVDFTQEENT